MQPNPEAVVCVGEPGINGLASIRSLGRRGVRVHVVSLAASEEFASASRFAVSVRRLASLSQLPDALFALARNATVPPLLMIDNDRMIRALQPHAGELRRRFRVVDPLAHARQWMDKRFQLAAAADAGIAVPRTWFPDTWEALAAIRSDSARPLIAKPSPERFPPEAQAPFKTVVAADGPELARSLHPLVESAADVLVQEYIEGDDSGLYGALAYRAMSSRAFPVLTVRKWRQTTPGAGIMALGQVVDAPEVAALTRRLLDAIDFRGVAHTEFKRCPRDGKYYFIEWNNRPGYFHSLGERAGFESAWLAYCDYVRPESLAHMQPRHDAGAYWINFHGDLSHLAKAPRLALRRCTWAPYFRRPAWAVYAADDLGPWVKSLWVLARWAAGRGFGGLARKAGLTGRRAAEPQPSFGETR